MDRRQGAAGRRALALSLCLLLAALALLPLGGCGARTEPARYAGGCCAAFDAALPALLPAYAGADGTDCGLAELRRGGACFATDVQAACAAAEGAELHWYPFCHAAVVIAVDRAQTDAVIRGWSDLAGAGVAVSRDDDALFVRLMFGAMEQALGGTNDPEPVLALLRGLQERGLLRANDPDAPLRICLDLDAAALRRAGRDIEIVIPEEGTLGFELGLLSETELSLPADAGELLVKAGLRGTDGRCEAGLYPAEAEYRRAARVEDLDGFLTGTVDAVRLLRRRVMGTRLYSTADGREHALSALTVVLLATVWGWAAFRRVMRRDVRRLILLICAAVVGWLLLRLFKYQIYAAGALNRACWYGFYIFQLGLPLLMLWLAATLNRPETARPPRGLYIALGLYLASFVLVFTNDWHQLVFRFDPAGVWSRDYRYGWGYVLVLALCVSELLLAVGLLMAKGRRSPRRAGWLFPALFLLLVLGYALGYAARVAIFRESDFTVTVCVFALLFLESALQTGLVPVNSRYRRVFSASPLNMQLLDTEGRTVLASACAEPPDAALLAALRAKPGRAVEKDAETLVWADPIHGGSIVWQEDVSELERIRRETADSVVRLRAANALLVREGEMRARRLRADAGAALFAELERELAEKTDRLAALIGALPDAADNAGLLARITLLLCCIKRRCNLYFLLRSPLRTIGPEFADYLDELSELAAYTGVKALVRCGLKQGLETARAALCYDFYYAALAWAGDAGCGTLLGQLEERDDAFVFLLLPAEEPDGFEPSPAFRAALERFGATIVRKELDGTAGVRLIVPKGGAADA